VESDHFSAWDEKENAWKSSVSQTLSDIGFPDSAAAFVRAGTEAAHVGGTINLGYKREVRLRRLRLHQQSLEKIAKEVIR
jgi:hypothetical protein